MYTFLLLGGVFAISVDLFMKRFASELFAQRIKIEKEKYGMENKTYYRVVESVISML